MQHVSRGNLRPSLCISSHSCCGFCFFFFFNDTATTEIYTLSLHDALPILLRRPGLVRGAVLLSPMVPFEPDPLPDLTGTSVFIGAGRADSMAPPAQAEHLADLLRRAGAAVTVHWEPGGHAVTEGEVDAARRWLWQTVVERPQERGMPIAKEN